MQLLDAGNVLVQLCILVFLAQLFPNGTHLLAQIVVPLVLVHIDPGLVLDLGFQLQNLNLPAQHGNCHFQALGGVQLGQKGRLVLDVQAGILADGIRKEAVVIAGKHFQLNQLGRVLRVLRIGGVEAVGLPAQCLASGAAAAFQAGDRLHLTGQIRLCLPHFRNASPRKAGDQDPQIFILGLQHLLDLDNGTHGIQVSQLGVVHHDVLLGRQKEGLILLHRRLQRQGRLGPAHIEVDRLIRENGQPPQGQDRHIPGINHLAHCIFPPLWS